MAELVEAPLVLPDGERIQQPLRGMRHMRLARRQHAHVRRHVASDQPEHAGLGFADHEHIHVQRFEREHRVQHALALHARGELHFEIHDLRAEPLRGELERNARARGGLGEQIRDRDAVQRLAACRRAACRACARSPARARAASRSSSAAGLERQQMAQRAVAAKLVTPPGVRAGTALRCSLRRCSSNYLMLSLQPSFAGQPPLENHGGGGAVDVFLPHPPPALAARALRP